MKSHLITRVAGVAHRKRSLSRWLRRHPGRTVHEYLQSAWTGHSRSNEQYLEEKDFNDYLLKLGRGTVPASKK